ncbi:hypothetical protein FGI60_12205 [Brucella haematophila]|nr:hypothetical protein FGI60_12205 [Brucella haematophila]
MSHAISSACCCVTKSSWKQISRSPPPECLIQKPPCWSANGNFCASGAHVPLSTAQAPVLEITIFAMACRFFDSDTIADGEHDAGRRYAPLALQWPFRSCRQCALRGR